MTERLHPVRKPRRRRVTDERVWALADAGKTTEEIATVLNCHRSTIDRSMARRREQAKKITSAPKM